MSTRNIWDILGIHITTDKKAIKAAYAQKAKEVHPEEHPEEFMELHDAYEKALRFAKSQAHRPVPPSLPPQKGKQEETKYDFTPHEKPSQTSEKQDERKTTYDFEQVFQANTKQPQETSSFQQQTYEFERLFEEAKQAEAAKLEKLRNHTLKEVENLIKQKRVRIEVWNALLEGYDFRTIGKDALFLKHLKEQLATYVPLPLHAILSLSIYYQDVQEQEETQDVHEILALLDTAYEIRDQIDKKRRKKIKWMTIAALLCLYLGICMLTKNYYLVGATLPFMLLMYGCLQLPKFREKKQLRPKHLILIFASVMFLLFCIIMISTVTETKDYERAQTWLEERYHTSFSYVKESENTQKKDTRIYKFYEPEHEVSFRVQASKNENDWIYKDNFLDQYLTKFIDDDAISLHIKEASSFPVTSLNTASGFDIVIPSLDAIPNIAKSLQQICEKLKDNPYYTYYESYDIYVYPEEIMFPHNTPPVLTYKELEGKSAESIERLLHKYFIYFQLDYTITEPDMSDPYAQEYFMSASGIDIDVGGVYHHFDDIHVRKQSISLGNFYRLAKHLQLDIQISGPNSFAWNIGGRVELFGTGTSDPFINQTYVEVLLR